MLSDGYARNLKLERNDHVTYDHVTNHKLIMVIINICFVLSAC